MDATGQVIVILKVLFHVGPVAVYFVALGLVNSQSTPKLVNARTDFLALTVVFCPLLFWPVPALIQGGLVWVVLGGAALFLPAFYAFSRRLDCDWVVYNVSDYRARRLLDRAVRDLRWRYTWEDNVLRVENHDLSLRLSALPMLRNVTVHVDAATQAQRQAVSQLRGRFSEMLATQQLLPSLTGSCLLMLGLSLLMLPLWMMSHHSDAIAEVVTRWLVS
ncbi:MAG: hypothetical protein JSV19_12280 [Phycisphaerales bacterium]|nr:MAG: hypothetical protein JSV19_12280 [Phycisphaerales bacterium]